VLRQRCVPSSIWHSIEAIWTKCDVIGASDRIVSRAQHAKREIQQAEGLPDIQQLPGALSSVEPLLGRCKLPLLSLRVGLWLRLHRVLSKLLGTDKLLPL